MSQGVLAYLNQIYPLSEELKIRLGSFLKTKQVKKKSFLLEIGQVSSHIYFLEKGLIRICYLKDGLEVCSGLLCEGGTVISVESFFLRQPSYEFIQAIENSVVHYISYDELELLYGEFDKFNIIGRKLITEYYIRSERRLYLIRKQSAQEKFSSFQKDYPNLAFRVPRKDIASYLGVTLETLSRLGY